MRYETKFELTECICSPVQDANDYLQEDNMLDYLLMDYPCFKDRIRSIYWQMTDDYRGKVVVELCDGCEKLTTKEEEIILDWIVAQSYDGLGEGFTSSDICCGVIEEEGDDGWVEETYISAEFDGKVSFKSLTLYE